MMRGNRGGVRLFLFLLRVWVPLYRKEGRGRKKKGQAHVVCHRELKEGEKKRGVGKGRKKKGGACVWMVLSTYFPRKRGGKGRVKQGKGGERGGGWTRFPLFLAVVTTMGGER